MCWLVPQPANMHHIVPNEKYIVALLQGWFYMATVYMSSHFSFIHHLMLKIISSNLIYVMCHTHAYILLSLQCLVYIGVVQL